jgi:hypothetical protein
MIVPVKENYPFGCGLDFDMNVNMVLVISNQLLFVNTHPLYELSGQLLGQIHIIIPGANTHYYFYLNSCYLLYEFSQMCIIIS